jgi:hypothetical protein
MNTINQSYRPATYWPASLTPEQLLSRIRGQRRQQIARELYENSGFTALNEFLVKEGLAEDERAAWGAVGPWNMGGEYLPELDAGEVEIARISMASTTSDQISVRARQQDGSIRYRIVGEYEEEEGMRLIMPFDTSEQPLTLGRLMELIDGACIPGDVYSGGVFTSSWEMTREFSTDEDEIVNFLSLSSPFYPEIDACYRELAENWLQERRLEEGYDLEEETEDA